MKFAECHPHRITEVMALKDAFKTDELIRNAKLIHMIGIGGSGMNPIAEILHNKGYKITGSDNNETDSLKRVRSLGIPITMGHFPENVHGSDLVIYSAAIMKDNPELVEAERLGIPTLERSYALGALTRRFDNVIGICGTHGKTTVTAMTTQILIGAGKDPSAVIGGKLPLTGSYGISGKSETMVVESCEYVDTFLKLSPDTAVILNIDRDHMEYFKTLDRLKQSFHTFASRARKVIVNGDDENTLDAVSSIDVIKYGLSENCDYRAENVKYGTKTAGSFDFCRNGERLCTVEVSVPGKHNISNACAAAAVAYENGVSPEDIVKNIKEFRGAGRRFEVLGEFDGITVADDYAHHPKELEVTLNAAMNMGYDRVIAVFQPFTYSRTVMLFDDFVRVLKIPDHVVLSEIMGSREKNTYGIYAKQLSDKIEGSVQFDTFDEITDYLEKTAKSGDLVITLGCGDIYKVAKKFCERLKNR